MVLHKSILAGMLVLWVSVSCHASEAQWQQYEQLFRQRQWVSAQQTLQAMAEAGDARASMTLAQWYRNGTGGTKNMPLARQWMQRAAETGLADAQYQLGVMEVKGIGGNTSSAEAKHWLTLAAQQGHPRAAEMLADNSWQGDATPAAAKAAPIAAKKQAKVLPTKEERPVNTPLQRKLAAVQSSAQRNEALRRAVLKDDKTVLAALLDGLEPGADTQVFARDGEGQTLVTLAAGAASAPTLSLLLKRAPVSAREDAEGRNALFHAVKGKRTDNVSLLLSSGVDPMQADKNGITPIMWAIESRSGMSLAMLAGIAPNRWDPAWIVLAARQGDQALVEQLLSGRVPPDHKDAQGRTALWYAVQNRKSALVDILLNAGASPRVADKSGDTPLHIASRSGDASVNERLLLHAGNITLWNRGNAQGAKPLHIACESGNKSAAEVLVKHGAKLDERDAAGNTPLMSAAGANQLTVVSWLLAQGASTSVRNHNKKTALEIAVQLGHENVIRALEAADAKRGVMSIFR
jgi:ankyrin repeat protein